MPLTYPYQQYQGVWTLSQASDAVAQGKWPNYPAPHLYGWGYNLNGQLGLGTNNNYYSSPKQVGSLTTWSSLATGQGNAASIKTDGTLWVWGQNNNGQLGLGNLTYYSSPKQVGALTNWLKVASGYLHVIAVKTDGTLWGWGSNNIGQLGLGNTTYYSSPKQVGSLTTWSSISCGYYSSYAIKTDGSLWSWGYSGYGQLGLGNRTNYSSPKQVGALTNWSIVSSISTQSVLAIKTDGTLWAWGIDTYGQLGFGNTNYYSSPKQVGSLTNWAAVAGGLSSMAVKTDGTLWMWGRNDVGQLGFGNIVNYSSPKQVGSLTNWSTVFTPSIRQSSFAIKNDGTLWSWGKNQAGQLGLNNKTSYSSPKQIGSLTSWLTISAGYAQVLAIAKT